LRSSYWLRLLVKFEPISDFIIWPASSGGNFSKSQTFLVPSLYLYCYSLILTGLCLKNYSLMRIKITAHIGFRNFWLSWIPYLQTSLNLNLKIYNHNSTRWGWYRWVVILSPNTLQEWIASWWISWCHSVFQCWLILLISLHTKNFILSFEDVWEKQVRAFHRTKVDLTLLLF